MRSLARRLVPVSIALALASTTFVAGSAATSSAAAAKAKPVKTEFGLSAVAIGTRVIGGSVPLRSDQTGAQTLSCTNAAGLDKRNYVAAVDVPGLGTVRGVSSRTWTTKKGGTVSSWAEHSTARVRIDESPLGTLDINGISSLARAWHDKKGFHGTTRTKIASVTFTPPVGPALNLTVPTPGRPLTVPGLARISVGVGKNIIRKSGAEARTSVVDIRVIPTETKALVGQTKAFIDSGIKSGVFSGFAAGLRGTAVSDVIGLGATPLVHMPCRGTRGKVRVERVAGVDIPGALTVSGLQTGVFGTQNKSRAIGQELARIAEVNLADRLVINGITALGRVTRTKKGKYSRSSAGTGVAELVIDGEPRQLLPNQTIEIPGLVKIENSLVSNTRRGMKVVGVRLTLLNGTGAVIELGVVQLAIRGAGLKK